MLSKEDNELLTRVDPGTPMGETLREYWIEATRELLQVRPGINPGGAELGLLRQAATR
jgi:phthalate 4,5-dioxygenase